MECKTSFGQVQSTAGGIVEVTLAEHDTIEWC